MPVSEQPKRLWCSLLRTILEIPGGEPSAVSWSVRRPVGTTDLSTLENVMATEGWRSGGGGKTLLINSLRYGMTTLLRLLSCILVPGGINAMNLFHPSLISRMFPIRNNNNLKYKQSSFILLL